jgi:hypothetical protein
VLVSSARGGNTIHQQRKQAKKTVRKGSEYTERGDRHTDRER